MIKRPAGGEAARLVAVLRNGASTEAEAAAARLVVLGARAIPHVLQALAGGADEAEASRLVALFGQLPPSRDVLAALDASLQDQRRAVAASALDAWGALLAADDATVAEQALDRLTAAALDETLDVERRARATSLLSAVLPAEEIRPLLARLADDPAPEVRRAATVSGDAPLEARFSFDAAADAESVRRFVNARGNTAPLPDLHRLVVLARERAAGSPDQRAQWTAVRATVHQALAQRGSTVALYDLREMLLQASGPPPVSALSALATVGDASCVDAIAEAYDRVDDRWTREQLTRAFEAIVSRGRLGRRHAALKRLAARNHPLLVGLPAGKVTK